MNYSGSKQGRRFDHFLSKFAPKYMAGKEKAGAPVLNPGHGKAQFMEAEAVVECLDNVIEAAVDGRVHRQQSRQVAACLAIRRSLGVVGLVALSSGAPRVERPSWPRVRHVQDGRQTAAPLREAGLPAAAMLGDATRYVGGPSSADMDSAHTTLSSAMAPPAALLLGMVRFNTQRALRQSCAVLPLLR
ncbi:hypothetical protein [Xanthomonas graminis]|uniref:hypothetical protein n=1 Tax=Xanthomonas graminis TaxID=3390026 RepID=UPI0011874869|nr:hypothetical protein [Xanthomonas translucens]UKE66254.1 hypothetical protein KM547_02670 [Xanthomonas translucens pv. phlei]